MPAGQNSDYVVVVEHEGEQEEIKVHRMLLESRSPFFKGMLESNMTEAQQGRFVVRDMLAPVVRAVLFFMYTGEPLDKGGDESNAVLQFLGFSLMKAHAGSGWQTSLNACTVCGLS